MSEQTEQTDLTSTRKADPAPTPPKPATAGAVLPERQKPTGRRKCSLEQRAS